MNHEQKLRREGGRTNYKRSLWNERGAQRTKNKNLGASEGRTNYKRSLWHEREAQRTANKNLGASEG